ncbi:MAG: hypothetical protein KKC19_00860 [Nanoarchaeota archaeon]|nr:hypothetical protein [Nanoarchaeota archaeon]
MKNESKSLDDTCAWEGLPVIGWVPYLRNLKGKREDTLSKVSDLAGYTVYQTIPTLLSILVVSEFYKASEIDQYLQVLFPFTL